MISALMQTMSTFSHLKRLRKKTPEQGSPDCRPGPERVDREQCAGKEIKMRTVQGPTVNTLGSVRQKSFRQPFPSGLFVLSGPSGEV
jgi:hypothetical protein